MLTPNTLLQNRYRVLHRIGGGGMGVVYLAADTRLAGRNCAIKEMSPAQLAPQDRNWAINAFRQEAQILARLSHPGLTSVTDFFPANGNWYLLMDYVEGETLEERLKRARGGRLPLEEALGIVRQLCNVLEYLHGQSPPVVFRDLKPGNVMLTPQGEVKLIDFGVARFFKPGRTRDTVNLGTPGYAAPEQFGGQGQSAPRTDIYSLGVLLHQMATGYDPTTADTPFPLPSPGSLARGLPQHVEEAISRAIRLQPDLRFQSVQELQRVLFPPTWVLPPQGTPATRPYVSSTAQPRPSPLSGLGKGIGIGIVGVLLLGLCVAAMAGGFALSGLFGNGKNTLSPTVEQLAVSPSATIALASPSPTVLVESATIALPSPTSTRELVMDVSLHWDTIGQSVQGRDIKVGIVGDTKGAAVVIVGSIQGDQSNTCDLVNYLADDFNNDRGRIPANVAFYFVSTINPDGNTAGTRRNAHDVDLNRNWDTFDWTANPEQPEGTVRGAGGSRPHSEPETQGLASYLLSLQEHESDLRVVVWHASQRLNSSGHVYPGYTSGGLDQNALSLAWRYANSTGYAVKDDWAPYETTGELLAWCAEESIEAIDIVIPRSLSGSNSNLRRTTMDALLEIAQFP
ncbi:MAG: protein kinase [Chloroflexota bacterium]|nr:protein kinase [Chloroflexota bacterium]